METAKRDALARAKERLDRVELYPRPVSLRGVRDLDRAVALPAPVVPPLRRLRGVADDPPPLARVSSPTTRLVAHELCHVWQMQHHPLRMPLSYLLHGYAENPYEAEARDASGTNP